MLDRSGLQRTQQVSGVIGHAIYIVWQDLYNRKPIFLSGQKTDKSLSPTSTPTRGELVHWYLQQYLKILLILFIDSQSLCFVWEIYFDHIVGANTHIGTYPVTADHRNTKLKKKKNYQGRKLQKATWGPKLLWAEDGFWWAHFQFLPLSPKS